MLYIAVALVAVILIAVVAMRMRPRAGQAPAAPEREATNPPSITLVDAPAARPAIDRQADPDATMVYMRPGQTPAPATARRLDDEATMTVSGVRLVALNGVNKGKEFPIALSGITIGRSAGCDIVLGDTCVSSRHAWIGLVDGKVTLRDLQSTNGTFLNAQLRTSISEAQLRPGDTIFFGGHLGEQFRYETD
jgi:hypothetical protein